MTKIIAVHGTGGGAESKSKPGWWQPGSDFLTDLVGRLGPQVTMADVIPFQWSGHNSQIERIRVSFRLRQIILHHADEPVVIIGHSHGGNIALNAVRQICAGSGDRRAEVDRPLAETGGPLADLGLSDDPAGAPVSVEAGPLRNITLITIGTAFYRTRKGEKQRAVHWLTPLHRYAFYGILFSVLAAGLFSFALPSLSVTDKIVNAAALTFFAVIILAALRSGGGGGQLRHAAREAKSVFRDFAAGAFFPLVHPKDEAVSILKVFARTKPYFSTRSLDPRVFAFMLSALTFLATASLMAWVALFLFTGDGLFAGVVDGAAPAAGGPVPVVTILVLALVFLPMGALAVPLFLAIRTLLSGPVFLASKLLTRMFDRLTWSRIRLIGLGFGQSDDTVRDLAVLSPVDTPDTLVHRDGALFFAPRYPWEFHSVADLPEELADQEIKPLPPSCADEVEQAANNQAFHTLGAFRSFLLDSAVSYTAANDIAGRLAEVGLFPFIHNYYFHSQRFRTLITGIIKKRITTP